METPVPVDAEAAIDDVLAGSFPASPGPPARTPARWGGSDPPPWTLGVTAQEAEMKITCRPVDSVLAEVEGVQRHIAQRAQEIFRARRGAAGGALEDWMKAERETIWRPALEVRRTKDALVIEAAVPGIEPKQFDVQVTPTELVLGAHVHHSDREQEGEVVLCEFANGPLFRSYKFPEPVDPARVSAEYRNGMLRVTAPLAQPATKVEIQAA
jgi:HSP20 family protein